MRVAIFAIVVALVAVGGWFAYQNMPREEADQAQQQRYEGMTSEEQLRARVQERWDALIALDMPTVYAYATPTYRATYDLRHLAGQYGGQIQRKRIDIDSVEIDEAGTTAKVNVLVWAETSGFGSGMIEVSTVSKGTWVKRDGLWWYVEPR